MDVYYLTNKNETKFFNYIIFMGAPWVSEGYKFEAAAFYTERQLAVAKRYYAKKNIEVIAKLVPTKKDKRKKKND